MSVLLKNAVYINPDNLEFTPCNIFTDSHQMLILEPGNNHLNADVIIDCHHQYVTRSFVCGHHHAYSALATGMPSPEKAPANFLEILQFIWWKLDKCLSREMIEICALITAINCAKNGVTFVIDHHSSPNYIKGSLQLIADAFNKVGLSHLLCYEITDRNGPEATELALDETVAFLEKNQGLIGLHASFTLTEDTMIKAASLTEKSGVGIHIHVAEDYIDQEDCKTKYQMSVIERLRNFGFLKYSSTILSHCLHITDLERDLLACSPVWIVQNHESNLNNRVGYFSSEKLFGNIMLGTDGMHSDMLRSAKSSFLNGLNDKNVSADEIYRRFRNAHKYLKTNGFKGDGDNNLVVLNYHPFTGCDKSNFTSHFVYGWDSKQISHVISGGKLIVRDGNLLTIDEDLVRKESQRLCNELWKCMKSAK